MLVSGFLSRGTHHLQRTDCTMRIWPVIREERQCSAAIKCAMSLVSLHYLDRELLWLIQVTDRKILDMLPGRPPQVTFSCNKVDATCSFQFWTAEVESFYCGLESCRSERQTGYDSNITTYACDKVKCSCVPGRFICGEAGSVGELLPFKYSFSNLHHHRYWRFSEARDSRTSEVQLQVRQRL